MDNTEFHQSMPERRRLTAPETAALLNQHREEIVEVSSRLMLPALNWPGLDEIDEFKAFQNSFYEILSGALQSGSFQPADAFLSEIAARSYARGTPIGTSLICLELNRPAVLAVLRGAYPRDADMVLDCISQLDPLLNYCAASLSRRYAAKIEKQTPEVYAFTEPDHQVEQYNMQYTAEIEGLLLQRHAQTQSVLDTARAASSTLGLDEILANTARMISRTLGLPKCIVNAINEEQKLLSFRRAGIIGVSKEEINAGLSAPDSVLSLEEIKGFGQLVLKDKKPFIVNHAEHGELLHTLRESLAGAESVLGLPLVIHDRVVGLAIVWTDDAQHAFSTEEIDMVQGIASVAALAIENTQLYGKAASLARTQERQRIALELHDNVAQLLFSIGLHANQALEDGGLPGAVRFHLNTIDHLAARSGFELRSAIFALEHLETGDESELVSLLRELVNDFQRLSGIQTTLFLPNKLPALPSVTCTHIYRLVRESLSNVQKHSRSTAALVSLRCDEESIIISIQDDGVGLPDQLTLDHIEDNLHFGLTSLRQMAQEARGKLTVTNNDDGGTLVKMQLPLHARENS